MGRTYIRRRGSCSAAVLASVRSEPVQVISELCIFSSLFVNHFVVWVSVLNGKSNDFFCPSGSLHDEMRFLLELAGDEPMNNVGRSTRDQEE